MDNLDKNQFFVLDENRQTRGNQFKLYKPRFESNIFWNTKVFKYNPTVFHG